MTSYVVHVNRSRRVFNFADGFDVMHSGYYVLFTNEVRAVLDIAGPFDDEHDAEMAAHRAEHYE